MADIQLLDKTVWGKIAAGEVVEKPASIIKELVENSIDAQASSITIEIKEGGTKLIAITDDGCGIKKDQIELAFLPHATSKLRSINDLYSLNTMGFRGEALASISAVSYVELITKTADEDIGHKITLEGGEKTSFTEIASTTGTQIKVSNLFYNTPARAKFLRKTKTEENDITNYVEKLMLANPNIKFKYIVDDKLIYNTTNCTLIDIIYTIYGKDVSSNMIEVNYKKGDYLIYGYISKPTFCKSNRTYQTLFVNKRYCINQMVSTSIANAYDTFLMKGKFPVYVLFLQMPQNSLDVNVHPNKLEVKFENSQLIYGLFNNAVYDALSRQTHIKEAINDEVDESENVSAETQFNKILPNEGVSFLDKIIEEKYNKELGVECSEIHVLDKVYTDDKKIKFEQSTTYDNPVTINIFENQKEKEEKQSDNNPLKNLISENEKNEQVVYESLFKATRKIIGVAFNTYIIVEEQDTLYLIDQHAAHERQLFDKFMAQINSQDVQVQDLLIPFMLNVNEYESEFIEKNLDIFNSYGFCIENFGKNCYRVTSIPMLLNEINLKDYFDDILSNLSGFVKKPQEIIRNNFATMACKAAIKAGKVLSEKEINILLDKLKENKNVLLCPHGRPIVITFDKKQLEKMFKRIV